MVIAATALINRCAFVPGQAVALQLHGIPHIAVELANALATASMVQSVGECMCHCLQQKSRRLNASHLR